MGFRKFLRFIELIYIVATNICLAVVGLFLVTLLIDCTCSDAVCNMWNRWGAGVVAIVAILLLIKHVIHYVRWYMCRKPAHTKCPKCKTEVPMMRYGEEKYLMAPVQLEISFGMSKARRSAYNLYFFKTTDRPYLQLDCPECGEKQVICPYCHEVIPPDKVKCYYDKPSLCPHCGGFIYTPTPLKDCDN